MRAGEGSRRVISWAPCVHRQSAQASPIGFKALLTSLCLESLRIIPNIDKASLANTRKVKNANSDDPSVLQNEKRDGKKKGRVSIGCRMSLV